MPRGRPKRIATEEKEESTKVSKTITKSKRTKTDQVFGTLTWRRWLINRPLKLAGLDDKTISPDASVYLQKIWMKKISKVLHSGVKLQMIATKPSDISKRKKIKLTTFLAILQNEMDTVLPRDVYENLVDKALKDEKYRKSARTLEENVEKIKTNFSRTQQKKKKYLLSLGRN